MRVGRMRRRRRRWIERERINKSLRDCSVDLHRRLWEVEGGEGIVVAMATAVTP